MIRMKKKAAAPAAEETTKLSGDIPAPEATEGTSEAATNGSGNGGSEGEVKLLGIGGKQSRTGQPKKAGKKRTPGEIRIQKDIAELDGGSVAQVDFPNPNDLTNFTVTVSPDSGYWQGSKYVFSFVIPAIYPHEPPKVTCSPKIYHPNINFEGNVCLNILREDWKPVLDINAVIYGLIYLFYEPNPDDPLNRDAADMFRKDRSQFERIVKRTLQGYSHGGEAFERII